MEGTSKDLARAKFKQHRGGRGRGRGRGPGRGRGGAARDAAEEEEDDDDDDNDDVAGPRPRRTEDWTSSDDDARGDGATPRLKSAGLDLEALFAECDRAALPRQHFSAYLDPRWGVDDLRELERAMASGGGGAGSGGMDGAAIDADALARQLAVLPLAELLGLPEDYHGERV